jgi:hypothetical protein
MWYFCITLLWWATNQASYIWEEQPVFIRNISRMFDTETRPWGSCACDILSDECWLAKTRLSIGLPHSSLFNHLYKMYQSLKEHTNLGRGIWCALMRCCRCKVGKDTQQVADEVSLKRSRECAYLRGNAYQSWQGLKIYSAHWTLELMRTEVLMLVWPRSLKRGRWCARSFSSARSLFPFNWFVLLLVFSLYFLRKCKLV